jgi:hypothetical protein
MASASEDTGGRRCLNTGKQFGTSYCEEEPLRYFLRAIKGRALKSVPALSGYFSTPKGLRFHRALLNLNPILHNLKSDVNT